MRQIATLLLAFTIPAAASADWLVMNNGSRVETRGEWKVKGKIVVFTLKNGTLSSLRIEEVDLDRSAQVTHEAENPPAEEDSEEAAPRQRPVVLDINDEDISRAGARPAREQGEPTEPGQATSNAAQEGGQPAAAGVGKDDVAINEPFELLTWKVEKRGESGLEILGTLAYRGEEEIVQGLKMIVSVLTPDGYSLAETSASLRTNRLRAGAATSFRAVFNQVGEEPYRLAVEVESREGPF